VAEAGWQPAVEGAIQWAGGAVVVDDDVAQAHLQQAAVVGVVAVGVATEVVEEAAVVVEVVGKEAD
jgi:hypothetical protein